MSETLPLKGASDAKKITGGFKMKKESWEMLKIEMSIHKSIKQSGMGIYVCSCGKEVHNHQTYLVPIITKYGDEGAVASDNNISCSLKCAKKWLAKMLVEMSVW